MIYEVSTVCEECVKHVSSWCAIRLRNVFTLSNSLKIYVLLQLNSADDFGLFGNTFNKHLPLARYCTLANIYFHVPILIADRSFECLYVPSCSNLLYAFCICVRDTAIFGSSNIPPGIFASRSQLLPNNATIRLSIALRSATSKQLTTVNTSF